MENDKAFYDRQLELAKEFCEASEIHKQLQAERRQDFEQREMRDTV